MGLALSLGRRNNGLTWPNPSVGAVLVSAEDGRIVATGATRPGGRPHAEAVAIEAAGAAARGAILYVSLEPCSHHGRTPPCADAIVAAGIARVVTALEDPDPRVAGRGHARLREAGVALTTGVLAADAARAHRGHLTRLRERRPFLTLKLARTRDGFAAGPLGEARLMISGEGVGARIHLLRAHADAILVGIGTVLADDPRLDVRLPGLAHRSPLRIVLDTRLRLPVASHLARTARAHPTWLVCGPDAEAGAAERLSALGIQVLRVATAPDGRLDLAAATRLLAERGVTRVFCEGGPRVADALAAHGLLDEICLVTGDLALGRPGLPAIGPNLRAAIDASLRPISTETVAGDTVEHFERTPCSPVS